jgi:ABC-type glycerol-3-phosphate transport system permease component
MSTVELSPAETTSHTAAASRRRIRPGRILTHIVLLGFLLLFMFPFYWMVSSALKPLPDIYAAPIQWWPRNPTLQAFAEVLGLVPSEALEGRGGVTISRTLVNSAIIAIVFTVASVFLSSLAGFAFAKLHFKGRNALFLLMLATMMIPNSVGLIPNYMIMARIGWVNTWWPLIIPGLASAFSVFWMRQYMTSVPDEMVEAAQIDGCGPFGIYWRVVIPVVAPGLAALAIFTFMSSWNAFLGPLIYLNDAKKYTVPLALSLLNSSVQGQPTPVHLVFAGSVISILPILALFIFTQRYFVAGLTAGSIK